MLLSGLCQAGTAWLRVAVLEDSREFCVDKWGGRGGWADPFLTAPLAEN